MRKFVTLTIDVSKSISVCILLPEQPSHPPVFSLLGPLKKQRMKSEYVRPMNVSL